MRLIRNSRAAVLLLAVLVYRIAGAQELRTTQSAPTTQHVTGTPNSPIINIWYGGTQPFGGIGIPQHWVNILGNVSDPDGISSLVYSLNGGATRSLSLGPDTRRLDDAGDFNVDLDYSELTNGANTIQITATNRLGAVTSSTVTLQNLAGKVWPLPYSVGWKSSGSLLDSAQVVDGQWGVVAGGIRPFQAGYDRLVAIGDTSWDSYDATVQLMVHGIDSTAAAFGSVSGGPGVGMIMRWTGHSDNPPFFPPITQPKSGYLPLGAIGWLHWRTGYGNTDPNRWELLGNNLVLKDQNLFQVLNYGVWYYFKMRVKSVPGQGSQYAFKSWEVGQPEPGTWLMTGQETTSDPQRGSVVLVAHHVFATFGTVTVTPISDGIGPVLGDIQSIVGPTSAVITWNSNGPGSSTVRYGLSPAYTDSVTSSQRVYQHSVELRGLQPNTLYHYRVVSSDWGGDATASGDLSFVTPDLQPPLAPTLLSPADNAMNQLTSLQLSWRRPTSATSFRVQVSTDPAFITGFVVNDPAEADTFRVVTGLNSGFKYYWRVCGENVGGIGPWSPTWAFTTSIPAPVTVSPANNATGQPTALSLRWRAVGPSVIYRVQAGTDSTFSGGLVLDDPNVVDTSRSLGGLSLATRYFWRVNARTSQVTSAYSPKASFTTLLPAPSLVFPANGSTGRPLSITFRWNSVPGGTQYRLQLATDSTFQSGIVKDLPAIPDTSRTVNGLVAATWYYWRVSGSVGSVSSAFSPTWSFRTFGALPSQVVLVSPPNPFTVAADSVRCFWRKSQPLVDRYWFEISIDSLFVSFNSIDSTVTDTTKIARQLITNRTYWWRVRAGNIDGWGQFSETRRLFVSITGVEDGAREIPREFAVAQNYPNPFNPSTRITLALPQATEVRVEVYSSLGERIATLVDGPLSAGFHTMVFDGAQYASGVYFYRVSTSQASVIRKMILVK